MSEEFTLSISFEMKSVEQMEDFEVIHEALEVYDMDEAKELLSRYKLNTAQAQISAFTNSHSDYSNKDDLLDMYVATCNENTNDIILSIESSRTKARIEADGYDHDAFSFCVAQILILVAAGATNINAFARSDFWLAKWRWDNNNQINLSYEEAE